MVITNDHGNAGLEFNCFTCDIKGKKKKTSLGNSRVDEQRTSGKTGRFGGFRSWDCSNGSSLYHHQQGQQQPGSLSLFAQLLRGRSNCKSFRFQENLFHFSSVSWGFRFAQIDVKAAVGSIWWLLPSTCSETVLPTSTKTYLDIFLVADSSCFHNAVQGYSTKINKEQSAETVEGICFWIAGQWTAL